MRTCSCLICRFLCWKECQSFHRRLSSTFLRIIRMGNLCTCSPIFCKQFAARSSACKLQSRRGRIDEIVVSVPFALRAWIITCLLKQFLSQLYEILSYSGDLFDTIKWKFRIKAKSTSAFPCVGGMTAMPICFAIGNAKQL